MRLIMRFSFILSFTIFAALHANASIGPQVDQKPLFALPGNPAVPDLMFNHVTVQLKDGSFLSGLLLGVGDRTLLLKRNGKEESVPLSQMARVIIEKNSNREGIAGMGMIMGTYLPALLGAKAQNQPFAFIRKQYSLSAFSLLWAFAGGGLGYLLGPLFETKQVEFDFSQDERQQPVEWEDLRKFILGVPRPAKLHLKLQGGIVNLRVSNRYETLFKNAGYDLGSSYFGINEWAEPAGNINLLRRLQITFSIHPQIEAGLAVYFLGEPSQSAALYTANTSNYVSESLSGTGYFGIVCYHPLQKKLPRWLSWNVGLGLGAAKVDFKLDTYKQIYANSPPYYEEDIQHSQKISNTFFGGVVFTDLDIVLGRSFSLGISADYVLLPSREAPAVSEMGIPAQKIRFGNSCIGLTMGLHY